MKEEFRVGPLLSTQFRGKCGESSFKKKTFSGEKWRKRRKPLINRLIYEGFILCSSDLRFLEGFNVPEPK